MEEVMRGK